MLRNGHDISCPYTRAEADSPGKHRPRNDKRQAKRGPSAAVGMTEKSKSRFRRQTPPSE